MTTRRCLVLVRFRAPLAAGMVTAWPPGSVHGGSAPTAADASIAAAVRQGELAVGDADRARRAHRPAAGATPQPGPQAGQLARQVWLIPAGRTGPIWRLAGRSAR